jgi:hypothetical protein
MKGNKMQHKKLLEKQKPELTKAGITLRDIEIPRAEREQDEAGVLHAEARDTWTPCQEADEELAANPTTENARKRQAALRNHALRYEVARMAGDLEAAQAKARVERVLPLLREFGADTLAMLGTLQKNFLSSLEAHSAEFGLSAADIKTPVEISFRECVYRVQVLLKSRIPRLPQMQSGGVECIRIAKDLLGIWNGDFLALDGRMPIEYLEQHLPPETPQRTTVDVQGMVSAIHRRKRQEAERAKIEDAKQKPTGWDEVRKRLDDDEGNASQVAA